MPLQAILKIASLLCVFLKCYHTGNAVGCSPVVGVGGGGWKTIFRGNTNGKEFTLKNKAFKTCFCVCCGGGGGRCSVCGCVIK